MNYINFKTSNLKPAVVLAAHTMGYGVIRSLGLKRVPLIAIYYDNKDIGYLSKYVMHSTRAPHPKENEFEFVSLLLNLGKNLERPVLIPSNDETLIAVSKFKKDLENYYYVACPDHETVLKYINKSETYKIAEELGIPHPKTFRPHSLQHLERISENVLYPCIVKPIQSHIYYDIFKLKMRVVKNPKEMKNEYLKAAEKNIECLIQEFIPGSEDKGYNFNSYRYSDNTLIKFTSKKIRYSDDGLGIPTCVVSFPNNQEITEQSSKLLSYLQYVGFSCIEYKFDSRDKKYKLMDINGRHNRSTLLALKCGINFPWIEYCDLVFKEKMIEPEYKPNIYWIDLFKEIENLPQRLFRKKFSLLSFIRPYFKDKIFADIDLRDIRPFIKRIWDAFSLLLLKLHKKRII